jgi:hypothetical protein
MVSWGATFGYFPRNVGGSQAHNLGTMSLIEIYVVAVETYQAATQPRCPSAVST